MKKIKLTKGRYAIVDDEDFDYLNRFRWNCKNNQGNGGLSVTTGIQGYSKKDTISVPMWAFLIQKKHKKVHRIINYKNGISLDFRKENLQLIDAAIAGHVRKKYKMRSDNRTGKRSKYKGLCWLRKNKKWQVSIIRKQNRCYVGVFRDEKEAAIAYNKKARELYGKLAYQNKI